MTKLFFPNLLEYSLMILYLFLLQNGLLNDFLINGITKYIVAILIIKTLK
jgi:hypothetical protein